MFFVGITRIFYRHHQNTLHFRTCTLNRWHIRHSWSVKEVHTAPSLHQMFHSPCWGDVRKTLNQVKLFWQQEQPCFTSVFFRQFPSHEATYCVRAPCAQQKCSLHAQKLRGSPASSALPARLIRACLTARSVCLGNAQFSDDALKEHTSYRHRSTFTFCLLKISFLFIKLLVNLSCFLQAAFGRRVFRSMPVTIKNWESGTFQWLSIVQSLLQTELDLSLSGIAKCHPLQIM